jgi:hypothetical protein
MTILTPFSYVGIPPTPSGETERAVREVLARMDPLLGIMWVPTVFRNERAGRWEGRYALTCAWPRADKRWAQVQSGEVAEQDAVDIIGWLCTDMQDAQSVPVTGEGVETRVLELLGKMDNTRYPWKQRMLATIEKNVKRHQATKNDALNLTHDVAEHFYRQAKGVPQSTGANFNSEGKLV